MANKYWLGGNWSDAANWSNTQGGAGGAGKPAFTDDALWHNAPTSSTYTVDSTADCNNFDFTGANNNPVLTKNATLNIWGNLIFVNGMTVNGNSSITFKAASTGKTITTNGVTISVGSFIFDSTTGGWTLQDGLICQNLTFSAGLINTNDKNISCATFSRSGTSVTNINLTNSNITVSNNFSIPSITNLTFNAGTSKIIMTGNSTTFSGAIGQTFNNLELIGNLILINITCTFNDLKFTPGKTAQIGNGRILTVTSLSGEGTPGNPIILQSSNNGLTYTINKTSGRVEVNFYNIKDCIATGGAEFIARKSVNLGNNTGWIFKKRNARIPKSWYSPFR